MIKDCTPPAPCKPARENENANLKAFVRLYRQHNRPHSIRELEFYRTMPSFELAVHHAALATDYRGKRYDHQRRLRLPPLERAKQLLTQITQDLKRCKSFHELLTLLEVTLRSTPGLGELYKYDTALRIGAFLGLAPEFVYLHCGTRAGARALGLGVSRPYLSLGELPHALRALAPEEIEDFLCIYKSYF